MDDRTFDPQAALAWIHSIETVGKSVRDDDIYPLLNEWVRRGSIMYVLDIGCGQGVCSDKIDVKNLRYTGVEPSQILLSRAIELYSNPQRTFLKGSAYQLPLNDGEFDGAFSVLVWHLLENLHVAARELSRVLKTNGHFLIITANPSSYSEWKDLYSEFKLEGKRLEGTMQLARAASRDVLYLYTLEEIQSSLQTVGLVVESTHSFRPSKNNVEQQMLIAIEGKKSL